MSANNLLATRRRRHRPDRASFNKLNTGGGNSAGGGGYTAGNLEYEDTISATPSVMQQENGTFNITLEG